jgi:putative hydroxymethylpyrimidine transport system substrate-binding protein
MRPAAASLLLLLALVLAGCGGGGSAAGVRSDEASLTLDFLPNAVHTGIYIALDRGYDGAEGIDLDVAPPAQGTDGVKLLAARRTDFAVLDLHDLALAREAGQDLVAVMAIVQQPLAAVLAAPDVRRPRDLEGRRVGVVGLPSDDAVLDAVVRGDGGDPRRLRRTTISAGAVPALLGGRVAGATAFWNAEGVALRRERPGFREFRLTASGAPSYPELVLVTRRTTLQDDPGLVRGVVAALRRGYREALSDPEGGVAALVAAEPDVDRAEAQEEFDAEAPAMTAGASTFGELRPERLRAWAAWEARVGITKRPPDLTQLLAPAFSVAGPADDGGE